MSITSELDDIPVGNHNIRIIAFNAENINHLEFISYVSSSVNFSVKRVQRAKTPESTGRQSANQIFRCQ